MNEFFLKSDISEIVTRIQNISQKLSGKTVLITGAKGFLGRYFIEIFKQLNNKHMTSPVNVIAVDNLITSGKYAEQSIDDPNIQFIEHDVTKPLSFDEETDPDIQANGVWIC